MQGPQHGAGARGRQSAARARGSRHLQPARPDPDLAKPRPPAAPLESHGSGSSEASHVQVRQGGQSGGTDARDGIG